MTASGVGLGSVFNVVAAASGVTIPLTRAESVAFVTYEDDGSTIATITEVDSTGTNAEQALDTGVDHYKGPGVGGTWTVLSGEDDTVDLADDTTNDSMVIHVHAFQLSDGYDGVQCTVDGGNCTAIIYDLHVQRTPANLASNIVA